ncbi:MAG: hypothetical protein HC782_03520, partial [Gammaproteobacteria bacterium]|nr:hypothetical protein [Gammaproteobacteria bacterium]
MSTDDFDFTQPATSVANAGVAPAAALFKPASSKYYDNEVAERFFKKAGKVEKFAAGSVLFNEGDKSGKQGLFG